MNKKFKVISGCRSGLIDGTAQRWQRQKPQRQKNRYFQFDEELPFEMIDGIEITISKGNLHRVIKGKGPLKIEVHKNILR